VFAEFEKAIILERIHAGLNRARAQGKKMGRPRITLDRVAEIRKRLQAGQDVSSIARELRCGVGAVMRIKRELEETK